MGIDHTDRTDHTDNLSEVVILAYNVTVTTLHFGLQTLDVKVVVEAREA